MAIALQPRPHRRQARLERRHHLLPRRLRLGQPHHPHLPGPPQSRPHDHPARRVGDEADAVAGRDTVRDLGARRPHPAPGRRRSRAPQPEACTRSRCRGSGADDGRSAACSPCYVPHGIDTDVFRPQPENKAAIRAELGIPEDAFLIGMVAANQGNPSFSRKGFPQAFQAFARFAHEHKDAWMYLHTQRAADARRQRHQPRGAGGRDRLPAGAAAVPARQRAAVWG